MVRCRRTEARKPRIEDERWAASGLSTRSLSPVSIRGSAVRLICGADIDASQEKAMQYLLMCCADEVQWAKLPDSQRAKIMEDYGKLILELKNSGRLLAGAKLDRSASAVTVREKNGKPVITDGPFAETKEQLGGYHLIECQDRDEAVAIALRIPTLAAGGLIEVRRLVYVE
jgi:hypothetical protein